MKFDRAVFFARYRPVFGKLAQTQVDGLNAILEFAEKDADFVSVRWLAYALATIQRETGISGNVNGKRVPLTFNPITELGGRTYFNRYEGRKDLGNNQSGDGFLYRGRGYVQITGRRNYTEFQKLLGEQLVSKPELALTPKVAWEILSIGMRKGIFVPSQTLQRYIPVDDRQKADYFTARKIINPGEIKAKPKVVKEMAENAVRWEAILRASLLADSAAEVIPETKKPDETSSPETSENPFDSPSLMLNGIHFAGDAATAEVQGNIGGEAQAYYVALFKKDTKVTIEFSFEADSEMTASGMETSASFSVSDESLQSVDFGQESNDGKTWNGVIPKSGPYYISVVAHPVADYTLTVTTA
jgi:putative chitinase